MTSCPADLRECAVRLIREQAREHASVWVATGQRSSLAASPVATAWSVANCRGKAAIKSVRLNSIWFSMALKLYQWTQHPMSVILALHARHAAFDPWDDFQWSQSQTIRTETLIPHPAA
jgi:hypothetical protein